MQLTIIDAKSQHPLLVLSEDDKGMSVVGGDPKYVQVLGLEKFSSLKEVADHINSAGSDVQAVFDQEQEEVQDNPDMDARIKPALELIRNLMQKVNDRKNREKIKENNDKPEHKLENTSESEVILNPNEKIYVSVDGDNIGNAVARAEEKDDEKALSDISNRINAGQDVLRDWAIRMGGYVVEQGGDEAVMKVPSTAMKEIEHMRDLYRQTVGATASVGVGKKISESTKARMLAKLKGKNRTVVFDSSTIQELDLRLKDEKSTEANKLRTAMRPEDEMNQNNPENPRRVKPDVSNQQMPQGEEEQQAAPQQESVPPQYDPNLKERRVSAVQQSKEEKPAPTKDKRLVDEEEEEKPSVGAIDDELVKFMNDQQEHKRKNRGGSKRGDSEIENMDFSEHDDPEFAKAAHYLAKHGGRE